METDIDRIKKLSEEKEDENWEFRTFLKMGEVSSKKVDSTVHRLYKEISSQIDCEACGNCCKEILPILNQKDMGRLSRGMEISVDQLKEQYLIEDEERGKYSFNKTPCPFLENNLCAQYAHRPGECVSYPHLQKKDFIFKTIGMIGNCSVCPIVFNVYEGLKRELWHMW